MIKLTKFLALVFFFIVNATTLKAASDISPKQYGLHGHKYATVYCKTGSGGRKPVWLVTDKATYALNGAAISWVQRTTAMGVPLIGVHGGPWKFGRDHFDPSVIHKMIQIGLRECQ